MDSGTKQICYMGLVLAVTCGCGEPAAPGPLQVIVSGDSAGWIVPCGCASNQSGGFHRRGTLIGEARTRSDVLYLDAGGAVTGVSEYDRLKLAAMFRGEVEMGLVAHNVGTPEAAFGPDVLKRLSQETGVTLLSANLRAADGSRVFDAIKIVSVAGRRVAIVGVCTSEKLSPEWKASEPREAVLNALSQYEGKYDTVTVLAYLADEPLRELARSLPEVDLVVGGPTGQAIPPEKIGPVLVASATNKGKYLARFSIGEPPQWSGEIVEVKADLEEDAGQQANLAAFYKVLGERDLPAEQTSFVKQRSGGWPEDYRIAGSSKCVDCHQADTHAWKDSTHSHAFETLLAERSHVDSYCQQCHTTGYGLPGGFRSIKQSPQTISVGCESCHGPSHAHAQNPRRQTEFYGRASEICLECHDPENSPQFAYAEYWEIIQHGKSTSNTNTGDSP